MSRTQQLSPAGSVARDDPVKDPEQEKTRRPPNTAFRQQRLKAWQPILTPKTVLPLLFVIGAVFAPIGGLLLYASAQVQELIIDYTDCQNAPSELTPIPSSRYNTYFTQNTSEFTRSPPTWSSSPFVQGIGLSNRLNYTTRQCTIEFYMPEALKPPVFMYYQLSNFYQNHRRYAQSYDQDQLMGKHPASDKLGTCSPLDKDDNGTIYYPCGLIANSVFNDSITAPTLLNPANTNSDQQTYNMTINGTSWGTDSALYVNGDATGYNTSEVVPPPFWKTRYPEGYNDDFPIPNLNTDDVFQNWMRAAALPTFVKLYRRNNEETMAIGRYQVNITYDFPAEIYGGSKSLMITTRTVMGGRNPSLGIAYIVIAGVCVLLGGIFTIAHLIKPRKLGDHNYLSWNSDKPSTATTTGRAPRANDAA